ncbi:uncharacterized protein LOC118329589 [Morone saxatilis]|uniref:uncharacterized protein LOC118329589 n=1 Tax=Morone saxatilis TaxID=34816 RepID=UPI0015E24FC7|nr:uncharacterized protein LOC118329589 [Morone saxatilis]
MAFHLSILLILTGLTGIHSITTVSKVSVKAGGSISIPCLYEPKYTHHVKYLCKGYYWDYCSYAVKTNQQSSGKFLISDDKSQRIFTAHSITYVDERTLITVVRAPSTQAQHSSTHRRTPSLYVDHQEITGFKGEKKNISCFHHNSGQKKWCRLDSSCVTGSGLIAGTTVTITAGVNVFNVTMSGLRTESSGWYFCTKGGLQMPVHVTVTEKPTTNQTPTITGGKQDETKDRHVPVDLKSLIISLSLLSFTVMVTLAEEEVTYSNVKPVRKASSTRSDAEMTSDVDVLYSSVVIVEHTPWLYVHHQEIAGFKGEKTTISCFHHNSGQKKWCRLGSSCVTGSGSIAGTRVTITAGVNVFSVTMSGLMIESSGWYWCVSGDFQMPVHVTVTEKPTTTTRATTTQTTTNSTTISPTSKSVNVTTVTMSIRYV